MGKLKIAVMLRLVALSGLAISAGWDVKFPTETIAIETRTAEASAHLTPEAAHGLIEANRANPDFVVLDVRTPTEVAEGHLASAINLDFHSEGFRQHLVALDRQKTYLIYCRSGVRSDRTLAIMQEMGFSHAYNLLGGISRWQRQGYDSTL